MGYLLKDAIYIPEAASYTADQVKDIIKNLREENPDNKDLAKRSDKSYLNEWAVHALCFRWGIFKDRARNAKLQFDMEPEVKFMYAILGPIARFFLSFYR